MPKVQPLMIVLGAQVVVLVGALGFFAARATAPAPKPHVEKHARAEPAEVHVELPKLEEKKAEPSKLGEWNEFPAEDAAPANAEPHAAAPAKPVEAPSLEALISELAEGNERFVNGISRQRDPLAVRKETWSAETAKAVVVTCSDSRVVPEVLFDQPLGSFAVVRLPGAELDEYAVRAVEESVKRLHPSAVVVLGHQGCHHVKHALSGAAGKTAHRKGSLEGTLAGLLSALEGEGLDEAATRASISFSARELKRKSKLLSSSQDVTTLRVMYTPKTGAVRWLDAEQEPTPIAAAPQKHRAGRR